MAQRRSGGPYIWATTLAKLLAGENSCEWAGWFKAHHQHWAKPSSDFDSAAWMLEHTALVNREREERERTGYTVTTENQNLFRLKGSSATLAGKPDLIARKGNDIVAIDAKTGRPSPAHRVQLMTYQYAVPKALKEYQGQDLRGQVTYPDSNTGIPASAVDGAFVENLSGLTRRLASETPARRVPSAAECRFCDITKGYCPDRIEGRHAAEGSTTDF